MGCGKSSIGKKLAKLLRLQFIDLDKYIANKFQKDISEIFETEGEKSFRDKETEVLKELCLKSDVVIATGGGTPCSADNMNIINNSGISIYLELNAAALFNRLTNSKAERPLIKNMDEEQLLRFIDETLKDRESFYNSAHLKVNGINLTAEFLFKELEKFLSRKD